MKKYLAACAGLGIDHRSAGPLSCTQRPWSSLSPAAPRHRGIVVSAPDSSFVMSPHLPEARAGSRDALGCAFDQCRHYLLQVARRSLGSGLRPKGGASDLVQETYL